MNASRKRRVLLINPNTTEAMTASMAAQLSHHFGDMAEVNAVTAAFGHPVIASRVAYTIAAHAALDAYGRTEAGTCDAVILGCFGDPGLEALREIAPVPVIGLAEAAFEAAAAFGDPFSILTIGPAWRSMLVEQLAIHPANALCRTVKALPGTGLDLARDPKRMIAAIDQAAADLTEDGVVTVVLGGAVLAGLAPRLTAPARFIDCLAAAAQKSFAVTALSARAQ
jgi:Asp/Glu/hydantoin racemase